MTPLAGALFFAGAAIALAALIHAPDIYARWVERKAQVEMAEAYGRRVTAPLTDEQREAVQRWLTDRRAECIVAVPAPDERNIEPPEKCELLFHVPPGMEWLWEAGDLIREAERQRDRAEPPVASFNFKRGARVSVEPGTEHLWAEWGLLGRDYRGGEVR